MKKFKFIHPITGESHDVLCDKVTGYQEGNEMYHHCTVRRKTVAFVPHSYAMIKLDDTL